MREGRLSNLIGYRVVVGAYFLFMLLLFFPYLTGNVLSPHRQFIELGTKDLTGAKSIENHKFSDFTNVYIPEIAEQLRGPRSSWLALWTNENELGRPLYHLSGFSPAYAPSWLLSRITKNPWRFITILSISTCVLGGLFIILYSREVGLTPVAGLIAGTGFAASPTFMYWLTFPMFLAAWCWSAGAGWALTRLARKADLVGWGALSFSGYSLLMTAYPQQVVYAAYLLFGYWAWLTYRKSKHSRRDAVRFAIVVGSAALAGAVLVVPVYRDLANLAGESARTEPDLSFFTVALPRFAQFGDVVRFFVLSFTPEFFGKPISTEFPFPYDGIGITLLETFLLFFAALAEFRRTWGWWVPVGAFLTLAFEPSLFALGVKYLGLNLSRTSPIGNLLLPLAIISAYGADGLIRRADELDARRSVIGATVGVMCIIATAIAFGLVQSAPIYWRTVVWMLILVLALSPLVRNSRVALLVTTQVIVLMAVSQPLLLRQRPENIATNSDLVDALRRNMPAGSRFAIVTPIFPPFRQT